MLKKVCAILCLVAIVCAAFVGIAMTAGAEEATMQAGYARVDINPYVVDGDPSSGIMALPLAGSGDVWNRLSISTLLDDNGDGIVDTNDGLAATVIAVTDKDGDAVLLITVDVMAMNFSSRINDEIMTRLEAEQAEGRLTDVKLVKENIYSASTHTHNAPDTTSYSSSGRTGTNNAGQDIGKLNEDLGLWISRTVEDIGDAAIMALEDRAATTITKDQLSAAAATSKAVKGKTMTMTRHYVVEQNGETFVAGDNFNATSGTVTARGNDPQQVTEADDNVYILNFAFKDSGKLPIILTNWRGHPSLNNSDSYPGGSRSVVSSDYVNAFRHALEYGVDVVIDETNNIGNVTGWTLGDTQNYRVAFFNGTGGNTNPRGYELLRDAAGNVINNASNKPVVGYDWIDKSGETAPVKSRACGYGVVLATLVNECITDGKQETVARAGEITSLSKTFRAEGKTVGCSQIAYDAGKAYTEGQTLYNAAAATYTTAKSAYDAYVAAQNKVDNAGFLAGILGYTSSRDKAKTAYETAMAAHNAALEPFVAFMTEHTKNTPTVSYTGTSYAARPDNPQWAYPWIYKSAGGETFVIGSKYHASYVVGDWNNNLGIPANNGFNVTVSAFMIGEDIAFVSIPGEPFDYYFKERGVYTPENNMWNDLLGDTYGKPYILGYTNGWQRYFANVEAYYYNEGSATKTFASYEVHNSDMEAGTGERAITELGGLLTALNSETRTAYCQYCKSDVQWQPYGTQTKLSTGHYYLCADCDVSSQLRFEENCIVCLDLNGFAIKGSGNRAFYLDDNKNETLNIFDSSKNQTGVVMGIGGEAGAGRSYGGGTVYIGPGTTMNLYSGTLKSYEKKNFSCQTGTVIRARGAFNIYGGKVIGGKAAYFEGQYVNSGKPVSATRDGMGGAIYVDGSLGVYGGKILGGELVKITGEVWGDDSKGYAYRETVAPMEGLWPCVYVMKSSSVTLSGNGTVEKLYLAGGTAAKLTVQGTYTGAVELGYPGETVLTSQLKIATAENADVSKAKITFQNVEALTAAVKGNELIVSESSQSYVYCQHCKATIQWTPVTDAELDKAENTKGLKPGHYVLTEKVNTTQKQLYPASDGTGTFCFDLNGYEFHGATRAFYVYNNATLNIQDSRGTGFVQGDKASSMYGGTIYCQDANAVVNVYGATIKATPVTTLRGSAIFIINGTVNLYDATVSGNHAKEYGATVFCSTNGKLNVSGGTIQAGKADILGDCVFLVSSARMTVEGNAVVDGVYLDGNVGELFSVNATNKPFTGSTVLSWAGTVNAGADVGNITGDLGMDNATVTAGNMAVVAVGSNLMTAEPAVSVCADGAEVASYVTLREAFAACTEGQYVRLNKDVTENITVSQNAWLDLNGCDLNGTVTVADNAVLYCMDSQTDDYAAMDEAGYGQLTGSITGSVMAVEANTVSAKESADNGYRAGYVMIKRNVGLSFHRVYLKIDSMALRPSAVGVYYNCGFKADEVLSEEIVSYGIALSVFGAPNRENLETGCEFSKCYDILAQNSVTSGTLLQNIMRTKNSVSVNAGNAATIVYGAAYIETSSGFVFGDTVARSLQQQVEAADAMWDKLTMTQKDGLLALYETYKDAMAGWNIPNIKAA